MANPNGPGWGVADAQFNGAMDWWRSLSAAEKQGYNDMYYGATMLIYPDPTALIDGPATLSLRAEKIQEYGFRAEQYAWIVAQDARRRGGRY